MTQPEVLKDISRNVPSLPLRDLLSPSARLLFSATLHKQLCATFPCLRMCLLSFYSFLISRRIVVSPNLQLFFSLGCWHRLPLLHFSISVNKVAMSSSPSLSGSSLSLLHLFYLSNHHHRGCFSASVWTASPGRWRSFFIVPFSPFGHLAALFNGFCFFRWKITSSIHAPPSFIATHNARVPTDPLLSPLFQFHLD